MSKRPDSEGKSGKRSGPAWLGKRQGGGRVKQDPDWKKPKVVQADPNSGYKAKRTLLWIVCLVLFGVFMYYLIPPRNTPLVVFGAAPYPLSMPPLALAKEDEIFLKQVSTANLPLRESVTFSRKEGDMNSDEGSPQKLLARLKLVKPSGPGWFSRSGNVVIYVAAHGLVNNKGQACLVPPTSSPFDPSDWLPLEDLLRDICALPNLQRARKIVILDCNRIGTRWRSGVLDNRFADRLKATAEAVNNDDLYILSSASPGQVAWSAPELSGSVFGHFVGMGLRGDASLEHGRDHNRGVVSLLELHNYLCDRVDDYVHQRRGVRQTPLLIGPKGQDVKYDIPIVSGDFWQGWRSLEKLKSPYPVLAKAKELIDPAGQKSSPVQLAWEAYQRRSDGPPAERADSLPLPWRHGFVLDPIRFATLEQKMMALEERFVAGQDYQEALRGQWEILAEELADKYWRPFPANQSVNNLRVEEWQRLASAAFNDDATERPTDFQALYQAWRDAKTPEEKNSAQFRINEQSQAIAAMLYRFGLDGSDENRSPDQLDAQQLTAITDFLKIMPRANASPAANPGDDPADFGGPRGDVLLSVEGQFLRLLRGNVSEPAQRQLTQAVLARSLAERAATPNDVRTIYALEGLVNDADAERRQAEDAFYLGDDVSVYGGEAGDAAVVERSAAQRWRRAIGDQADVASADANVGYRGADKWSRELESMFLLRDSIWARMPHVAEWFYRRSRLEMSRTGVGDKNLQAYRGNQEVLLAVMNGNVLLAEQLEQLLKSRGQNAQIRTQLSTLGKTYDELQGNWQALLQLAGRDAAIIVDAEGRFETPDAVRRIELLMQTPLVVDSRSTQLLAKYRNTLDFWAKPENALSRSKTKPAAKSVASQGAANVEGATNVEVDKVYLPEYSKFWVDYHRLLTHKFISTYATHLETIKLKDPYKLDHELRNPPGQGAEGAPQQDLVFQVLGRTLSDYNAVFSNKASVLAPDAKDFSAREELSQWDRRLRAGAYWLPCVDASRISEVNIATLPSARLRAVDHWHLTCWHAYRLLHDFWGNGQLSDRSKRFFELSTNRCETAIEASGLPFRYEIPGAHVENLADLLKETMAYQGGLTLHVPNVKTLDPKSPTPLPVEATVQQGLVTVGQDPAKFPAGRAGFFLARPLTLEPLPPEVATWGEPRTIHRAEVPLKDVDRGPLASVKIPAAIVANQFPTLPAFLEGRLWYRGHVWEKKFELYGGTTARGLRLVHEAKKYSAPSVQVSGSDAPSGAVLFVFDGSSSMRNADGRFAQAKKQLTAVLEGLNAKDPGDLQIGLMAYGLQTPTEGGKLYLQTKKWNQADNLTPEGKALEAKLGKAKFALMYPHPDRDVKVLVPTDVGWKEPMDRALDDLDVSKCIGVTPLYFAIAEAIREVKKVKGVDSRQVIVISDGVNFPYGGQYETTKAFTEVALDQNADDLKELKYALAPDQLGAVKVRVVLFGGVEATLVTQLDKLKAAGKKPEYVVDTIPDPDTIRESIEATFEKPNYGVTPPSNQPAAYSALPFDKVWIYPQWPAPRDLLPTPSKHEVEVRGPRLRDPLLEKIELSGGEAIALRFDARVRKLFFVPEQLVSFTSAKLEAVGNADPFVRPVVAEILKPEPPVPFEETSDTKSTMLRVRLRSEFNDAFVRRPRFVWAEIQPNSTDPKYQKLIFQISDLKFMEKTSTPILEFIVPQWPKAVRSARINLWVRYTTPPSALSEAVKIEAGESNFAAITGKDDLDGVTFRLEQQRVEGVKRIVRVIESHPAGTPLSRLYRTRVQLNPPAQSIERMYIPADGLSQTNGEVVHTFTYLQDYLNDSLTLEVNSAEQIKESSLRLERGAPLLLPSWNP